MKFLKGEKSKAVSDKAAGKIAAVILTVQRAFANSLYAISKQWNKRQQTIFLVAMIVLFGGMSVYSIAESFHRAPSLNIATQAHNPIPVQARGHSPKNLITESEFMQVQEYKSLHPELAKERPALFDSLIWIEDAYYLQKNRTK